MLDTGRPKDRLRLIQFFEEKVIDQEKFEIITARHHLNEKWNQFKTRFLDEKA